MPATNFKPQINTVKYIENHINLIDNEQFELLYTEAGKDAILARDITDILLASGINPLEYMYYIPNGFARGARRSMKGFFIPDGIEGIEGFAFGATDISAITVPDGCKQICRGAFSRCPELESIWLPASLYMIGDGVFNDSNPKLTIYYKGTCEMWHMINKTLNWFALNEGHKCPIVCSDKITFSNVRD